jgi:hypothetical protein
MLWVYNLLTIKNLATMPNFKIISEKFNVVQIRNN